VTTSVLTRRTRDPRRRGDGTQSRPLVGLGEVLITAGVLVAMFVLWQLWWTDVVAGRDTDRAATDLARLWDGPGPAPGGGTGPGSGDVTVRRGEAFALLRIPRFGADWRRPVVEGTSAGDLRRGVGHYPGTALPGQVGNLAVAGHRTTYGHPFRDLDSLVPGDLVLVETAHRVYGYRVLARAVVAPTDTDVVAADPDHPDRPAAAATRALLTLTTCHPEFSARQRLVVRAELVSGSAKPAAPQGEGL
jgi:sortase A